MRVLLIPPRYYPHIGGVQTVVNEIAAHLRAQHTLEIVTSRQPRTLPRREIVDDVPVTRVFFFRLVGNVPPFWWLIGLCLFPLTFIDLGLALRRFRPDVVNLHFLGSQRLFVLAWHLLLRFPLVLSLHGADVEIETQRTPFDRWLFRVLMRRADVVTSCSQALLSRAVQIAPEANGKSTVIHNGVHEQVFAAAAPHQHERRYILGVGRLVSDKGFDLLLDAFARLNLPDSDLIIAGDGDQAAALCAQAERLGLSERVRFWGSISRDQVASFMAGAALIAIPSRREPFGIVGLEALASGCPAVVARVGGLVEALGDADVTWFTPNSVDDLARALSAALRQPHDRERNQAVARRFTWEQVAERYQQAWNAALKTRSESK
jgi:glycosyltransferase involved in cell wall biosynthesis